MHPKPRPISTQTQNSRRSATAEPARALLGGWFLLACSAQELPSAGRPQAETPELKPVSSESAAAEPVARSEPSRATTLSSAAAAAPANPDAAASGAPASSAEAAPTKEPKDSTPPLRDAAGAPLAQTDARPQTDSPFFLHCGARLFDAIVTDDSALALPCFFPVVAYEQVKDIAKPARDWEYRLVAAFKRNLHDYHKRLGSGAADARFLRVDVPEAKVQWMKPGSEGNRVGYYRVLRSNLVYRDANGKEAQLGITSLISWRGEWYVVHLDGFK